MQNYMTLYSNEKYFIKIGHTVFVYNVKKLRVTNTNLDEANYKAA